MYAVDRRQGADLPHLTADEKLGADHFTAIARELSTVPIRARKTGFVAATKTAIAQRVTTHWNGEETVNIAKPGDYVVANLSPLQKVLRDDRGEANIYVIRGDKFSGLYELDAGGGMTEFGPVYRARGEVIALYLAGGFEILAPWGEVQRASRGYILKNAQGEVYGNADETFLATYKRL